MKISYNWLKTLLNVDLPADEVSKLLTDTGLEVEGVEQIESIKGGLSGVIIGEVVEKTKHENADKLNVTKVNIGEPDHLQIVCGAPNVEQGQKVLVATVGCTLYPTPDEKFEIKKAKIRGIESFGMICAEDELGLGESHEGIMVLPKNVQVGQTASEYFKIKSDTVFEIGLTPNRTDALGHIGVARDLKAAINVLNKGNLTVVKPEVYGKEFVSNDSVKLIVSNTEKCPYYSGAIIKKLQQTATPDWMVNHLKAIGQKSINVIVDITNYVMFETGQPLHAFDLDKVGDEIIVRTAKENETFTTLDDVERKLDVNDLVIANKSEPMCLAGVFGGSDSGVSSTTNSIFIEAAYFNPVSVRKTAKRHGLSTDSSFRFERGVDPNQVDFALRRAVQLIIDICGGEIDGKLETTCEFEKLEIEIRIDQINKVIGHVIPEATIKKILTELEIEILTDKKTSWLVSIPTYRVDVTREIDVIEEILRIYGFNNIPLPTKLNSSLSLRPNPDKEKLYNRVADLLVDNGYSEIMNNSLTSYEDDSNTIALLNPLSRELKHLRKELQSGGLKNITHNQNRQFPDLKFFEFGKTYQLINEKYIESERIGIWHTGAVEEENWNSNKDNSNIFSLKGLTESIIEKLGISGLKYSDDQNSNRVIIKSGKQNIGWIESVDQAQLKAFGVKNPVYYAELDWSKSIELSNKSKVKYKPLPKTQFVRRDFSLLLNDAVKFDDIRKIALKVDNNTLKKVGLFDVYEGKNIEKGKKSYAVSFYFQDQENTLQDELVDGIMGKIRVDLETQLKAELR